jgi:hypothetical protein
MTEWMQYDVATHTYRTKDGTVIAAELVDNISCLADVLYIATIRHEQRKEQHEHNRRMAEHSSVATIRSLND